MPTTISDLPDELALLILSFLPTVDIVRGVGLTNRALHSLIVARTNDVILWNHQCCQRDFNQHVLKTTLVDAYNYIARRHKSQWWSSTPSIIADSYDDINKFALESVDDNKVVWRQVYKMCFIRTHNYAKQAKWDRNLEFWTHYERTGSPPPPPNTPANVIHIPNEKIIFKLLLLGAYGVGKRALRDRFAHDDADYSRYYGVDFAIKTIQIKNNIPVKLLVWCAAGIERFKLSLPRSYYRNVHGILIVFDISDAKSFDEVEYWIEQARERMHNNRDYAYRMVLVGNKSDLSPLRREVTVEQAQALAKKHGMHYFETSASTGRNVDVVFENIAEEIFKLLQRCQQYALAESSEENLNDIFYKEEAEQHRGLLGTRWWCTIL